MNPSVFLKSRLTGVRSGASSIIVLLRLLIKVSDIFVVNNDDKLPVDRMDDFDYLISRHLFKESKIDDYINFHDVEFLKRIIF